MTLTYRIPEADLPPLPADGHHDVTVRARNFAGAGEEATPVPVRTLETLRKRMIRVNGRWVRVDDLAFATALQGLSARTLEDESGVITLAERITALQANIADVTATAIESLLTRVEMAEGRTEANAAQITSLVADIAASVTATAFQELVVRVTSTENVDGSTTLAGLARWLVKTTVGDLVAGVGLYNDGMTSRFTVAADRFMILPPDVQDDEDGRIPFAVVNGQVFINEAVIREASIGVAKIQNGFLTNLAAVHGTLEFARIRKGDIFDLTINNIIQSVNYVPGVAGWAILRDGTFELNSGAFRGELRSNNYIENTRGWRITAAGEADFVDVQNIRALWLGNLTFSGSSASLTLSSLAGIDSIGIVIGVLFQSFTRWGIFQIPAGLIPSSGTNTRIETSGNDHVALRLSGSTLTFQRVSGSASFRIGEVWGLRDPNTIVTPPDPPDPPDPTETTVTANAGSNRNVESGGSVQIGGTDTITNGVGSTTISWSRVSGVGGSLSSTSVASPTFNAPTVTSDRDIIWRKTTTNNGVSDTDDVTVTVTAPVLPPITSSTTWNSSSDDDPFRLTLETNSPALPSNVLVPGTSGVVERIVIDKPSSFNSGEISLSLSGTAEFTAAVENGIVITFSGGSVNAVSVTGISDPDEPYNWLPSNAAAVATWADGVSGGGTVSITLSYP